MLVPLGGTGTVDIAATLRIEFLEQRRQRVSRFRRQPDVAGIRLDLLRQRIEPRSVLRENTLLFCAGQGTSGDLGLAFGLGLLERGRQDLVRPLRPVGRKHFDHSRGSHPVVRDKHGQLVRDGCESDEAVDVARRLAQLPDHLGFRESTLHQPLDDESGLVRGQRPTAVRDHQARGEFIRIGRLRHHDHRNALNLDTFLDRLQRRSVAGVAINDHEGVVLATAFVLTQISTDRLVDPEAFGLDRLDDVPEMRLVGRGLDPDVERGVNLQLVGRDQVHRIGTTIPRLERLQRTGIERRNVGIRRQLALAHGGLHGPPWPERGGGIATHGMHDNGGYRALQALESTFRTPYDTAYTNGSGTETMGEPTIDVSGHQGRDLSGRPMELPASRGRGLATAGRVHAACDHLLARGARITEPAIREIVGGGSKTSIYAHIETWYGRLQDELRELRAGAGAPGLPDLPAPLLDALRETWHYLATRAEEAAVTALRAEREALARDRADAADELQRERQRLAADRERWAEERAGLVAGRDEALRAHAAARDRVSELKAALALAEERLTGASAQLTAALGRTRELESAQLEASERYTRDTAALLVRFDAERQSMTKDLASANTARAAADARVLEEREARLALATERASLEARLDEASQMLKQARETLAEKDAAIGRLAQELEAIRVETAADAPEGVSRIKRRIRRIANRRTHTPRIAASGTASTQRT